MADGQHYTPDYLQALLRSNPGSPEELAQAKEQIDLYFADLNRRSTAVSSSTTAVSSSTTASATPAPSHSLFQTKFDRKMGYLIAGLVLVLISTPFLFSLDLGKASPAQEWLLYCIPFIYPLVAIAVILARRAKSRRAIAQTKTAALNYKTAALQAIAKGSDKKHLRHRGEQGDSDSREKWKELQKLIEKILASKTLKECFDPAEESISLIGYLTHRHKHRASGTNIDPLNTLIERLIEEHELEWADKLSHHYLSLLTRDFV